MRARKKVWSGKTLPLSKSGCVKRTHFGARDVSPGETVRGDDSNRGGEGTDLQWTEARFYAHSGKLGDSHKQRAARFRLAVNARSLLRWYCIVSP